MRDYHPPIHTEEGIRLSSAVPTHIPLVDGQIEHPLARKGFYTLSSLLGWDRYEYFSPSLTLSRLYMNRGFPRQSMWIGLVRRLVEEPFQCAEAVVTKYASPFRIEGSQSVS